jgi:hypothetical protein
MASSTGIEKTQWGSKAVRPATVNRELAALAEGIPSCRSAEKNQRGTCLCQIAYSTVL